MKVIFMSPPSQSPLKKDEIYPLGLAYLAAVLEERGHQVLAYDFFNEHWLDVQNEIKWLISNNKPDLVGLTCLSMNRLTCLEVAKIAKGINQNITVLMGNVHASLMYNQILSHFPIDIVIRGEGERTITEVMDAIEGKLDLTEVKGIAFSRDGKMFVTQPRDFIRDLDTIPFPEHKLFEEYIQRTKKANIITSRGCPIGCKFCSVSHYWGKSLRIRSPGYVIDEIEFLINSFGARHILFSDDTFNIDLQNAIGICKEIIKRAIKVTWNCQIRVSPLNEELVELMSRSGCISVGLGVESGSPRILKEIGKSISVAQIEQAFELFYSHNITPSIFLMVGFPGETNESILETADLCNKLVKRYYTMERQESSIGLSGSRKYSSHRYKKLMIANTIDDVQFAAPLQLYPGTPYYEEAEQAGIINDDYWLTDKGIPIYTKEYSLRELLNFSNKIVFQAQRSRGSFNFVCFLFARYSKPAYRYFREITVGLSKYLNLYPRLRKFKSWMRKMLQLN